MKFRVFSCWWQEVCWGVVEASSGEEALNAPGVGNEMWTADPAVAVKKHRDGKVSGVRFGEDQGEEVQISVWAVPVVGTKNVELWKAQQKKKGGRE